MKKDQLYKEAKGSLSRCCLDHKKCLAYFGGREQPHPKRLIKPIESFDSYTERFSGYLLLFSNFLFRKNLFLFLKPTWGRR
jgi:hypothetical protein